MISYIRHNSVFDLGTRTGVSSCEGLYAELDDIYSKFINPQVRVQYETNASSVDCLCNMSGKQTLSGNIHAFIFQNGLISVTVDEDDNVTVAEVGSGGGGGGMAIHVDDNNTMDKTWQQINDAILAGTIPIVIDDSSANTAAYFTVLAAYFDEVDGYGVIVDHEPDGIITYFSDSASGYPEIRGSDQPIG